MEFLRPESLSEALAMKAAVPDAVPIAGGTDVMVELNFDHRRPPALLDLTRIDELSGWSQENGVVHVGAGLSYTRLINELGSVLPGLAIASRTVASPQVRNRGTVGGNLGTASPAGDTHPVLLACDAQVEVASTQGTRLIAASDFYLGVKRNAMRPDELITKILVPAASGPQQFAKVGTRNAMVIAVCSFAISLGESRVRAAIGSAAPTPRRVQPAEEFLAGELDWVSSKPLADSVKQRFGELVAAEASPIDDVRGTAAYRKHALAVLARRTLGWAWDAYRRGEPSCA